MYIRSSKTPLALALAALFALPLAHAADDATATAAAPEPAPDAQPQAVIEIKGSHFKAARVELSPKVGTTIYSIDTHMVDKLAQGDAAQFNDVLQRLPGVSADSKGSGSLHIRGDHGNMQYRVNGVQLPEGISGFGQSFDTRLVDQIDFMTGALPAQYGLRTAGVIEIQTKEGGTEPGGRVGLLLGSRGHVEPNAEFFGSAGNLNYYLSGSVLKNEIGIENPTPARNALHDDTHQGKGFGSLSYFVDDTTRLGLLFSSYHGRFQIPNNPGQDPAYSLGFYKGKDSAQLDDNQREQNRFAILSLQKTLRDGGYQLSVFNQASELHYTPDLAGDLLFSGVASDALRSSRSNGLQFDANYKLRKDHVLRAGLNWTRQTTASRNLVSVFPVDAFGAQTDSVPLAVHDDSGITGNLYGAYLQDEWHPTGELTVNYGLRFDKADAWVQEQQWSPRVNLSYKVSDDTSVHAGYSRYFTPPKQELTAQANTALYAGTTNAAEIKYGDPVKSERMHYFDVGISHHISKELALNVDAYYKNIRNLLDEGQFGRALIQTPFNYERGRAQGLEVSALYTEKNWGMFLNVATQEAMGRNIISGQTLFGTDELAMIASQYIHVDHDQTYSISGGGHYHHGDDQFSGDFVFGSGLRRTAEGGIPNGDHLPAYLTANIDYTHTWKTPVGKIEGRLAVVNLFDKTYLLRDGSGVGVGAPQFGLRRTFYAGVALSF